MSTDEISARINIDGAKEAQKDLADTGKAAKKLDGTKAEVEVKADNKKARKSVEEIVGLAKKLDGQSAELLLKTNATGIEREIRALIGELGKLDAEDPTVDVKVERLTKLQGDLEEVKTTIKEIGDQPIDLDTSRAKKGIDDVGKSADSSKSVLANMVGNATQDLGALGGVAGSAGVAIGQMGEYIADAKASGEGFGSVIKSFAGVAAPIAAIGIATQLISDHFKDIAETKAFNKERVDAYVVALEDAKVTANELLDILNQDQPTGIFARVDEETRDLDQNVARTLGTFAAFQAQLAQPRGVRNYADSILAAGDAAGLTANQHLALERAIRASIDGEIDGGTVLDARIAGFEDEILTLVALGAARRTGTDGTKEATFQEEFYGSALDDTTTATGEATAATEAQQKELLVLAARHEAATTATEAATQAQEEFNRTISSTDWQATELSGALAGMSKFHDQFFGLAEIASNNEAAIDDFTKSVKTNGKTFDLNTEAGRANQQSLEDLAATMDTQLAAAYDASNGDLDTFKHNADVISQTTLARLQKEMGLSAEETMALGAQLGLLPEDVETRYKLSQTEEARQKIALLQGSIDALPKDVQAKVTQLIIKGDYVGALAAVESYWKSNPADMPSRVEEPDNKQAVLNSTQGYFNGRPVKIPATLTGPKVASANGNPSVPFPGGIAGEAGPEFIKMPGHPEMLLTSTSFVPPGTRVTSTKRTAQILREGRRRNLRRYDQGGIVAAPVSGPGTIHLHTHINSSVIGSRFELMRTVNKANQDAARLLGSRA